MSDYSKVSVSSNVQLPSTRIRVYKTRWIMLCLFVICCVSSLLQWIQYCIIADTVAEYYGVSYIAVDWSSMIYLLVYILFIFPGCYIIDTLGLRISMIICMVGTCVGSWIKVASVSPDRYWVVLFGQGIVGIFEVFLLGVPPKLAAVWFGPHEVSTACSIGVLGSQLGVALGFVFPPMLMNNATTTDVIERGFYVMSITVALVVTAVLIVVIVFFRDRPPTPPSTAQIQVQICTEETGNFWKSVKTLSANKSYILLVVSYGINTGILYAVAALLNQIILIYYPNAAEDAGRIGLIIIVSGMIGSVVCGVILDSFGRFKLTIVTVYVLCLISMITFTFTLDSGLVTVYCISVFLGFFLTALLPIGYELAVELTFPIGEGTSGGIITAVAQAFGILFTYLYTYLLNVRNDKTANMAMAGALTFGAVLLLFIDFELKRQKAQVSTKRSSIL